jgi:hypothetical protein
MGASGVAKNWVYFAKRCVNLDFLEDSWSIFCLLNGRSFDDELDIISSKTKNGKKTNVGRSSHAACCTENASWV